MFIGIEVKGLVDSKFLDSVKNLVDDKTGIPIEVVVQDDLTILCVAREFTRSSGLAIAFHAIEELISVLPKRLTQGVPELCFQEGGSRWMTHREFTADLYRRVEEWEEVPAHLEDPHSWSGPH